MLNEHTLLIIMKGELTLTTQGGKDIKLKTGEMAILPMKSTFKVSKTFDRYGDFSGLFICLKNSYLRDYIVRYNLRIPRGTIDYENIKKIAANDRVVRFAQSLCEMVESLPDRMDCVQCMFDSMFYELEQKFPDFFSCVLSLQMPQIVDLPIFMEHNYLKNFTLDELALLTGRSVSKLKRDFYRIYGMTPHDWIVNKKLECAYRMVQIGDMTVAEVSDYLNFNTTRYFSTIFKNKYGVPPSALFPETKHKQKM